MKKEQEVMDELDNFFEENERRKMKLKLLIDEFPADEVKYVSPSLSIDAPKKKKFHKKTKTSRLKDQNSKKNLF